MRPAFPAALALAAFLTADPATASARDWDKDEPAPEVQSRIASGRDQDLQACLNDNGVQACPDGGACFAPRPDSDTMEACLEKHGYLAPAGKPCKGRKPACLKGSVPACAQGKWRCRKAGIENCAGPLPSCPNPSYPSCVGGRWTCLRDEKLPGGCGDALPVCKGGGSPVCVKKDWVCPAWKGTACAGFKPKCAPPKTAVCLSGGWKCEYRDGGEEGCGDAVPPCRDFEQPRCLGGEWTCVAKPD